MSESEENDARQAENLPCANPADVAAALVASPEAISALSSALAGPLAASLKDAGVFGPRAREDSSSHHGSEHVAGPSRQAVAGPSPFYVSPGGYNAAFASRAPYYFPWGEPYPPPHPSLWSSAPLRDSVHSTASSSEASVADPVPYQPAAEPGPSCQPRSRAPIDPVESASSDEDDMMELHPSEGDDDLFPALSDTVEPCRKVAELMEKAFSSPMTNKERTGVVKKFPVPSTLKPARLDPAMRLLVGKQVTSHDRFLQKLQARRRSWPTRENPQRHTLWGATLTL